MNSGLFSNFSVLKLVIEIIDSKLYKFINATQKINYILVKREKKFWGSDTNIKDDRIDE